MRALPSQSRWGGNFLLPLTALLVLILFVSGCGNRKNFPDGDIRSLAGVYYGTVIDVAEIMVAKDSSLAGTVVGGVVGAIIGSQLSGLVTSPVGGVPGTNLVLTAAGIVVGASVGSNVQTRSYRATQITMELNNGKILIVVQGSDEYFVRGDKVRILHMARGRAKVQHI